MESNTMCNENLDMLETPQLVSWVKEHIIIDSCDVLCVVSDKLIEMASEDNKLMESLQKADALFSANNIKLNESEEEIEESEQEDICSINEKVISEIADDADIDRLSIMVMSNDESVAMACKNRVEDTFENFDYIGEYVFDKEIDDDLIINEINANLPDILLCSFDSPRQEEWIVGNKNKMNVKLCVALCGDTIDTIFKRESGMRWITRIFSKQGVFGLNII